MYGAEIGFCNVDLIALTANQVRWRFTVLLAINFHVVIVTAEIYIGLFIYLAGAISVSRI
jgi:hypothetical protein